MALHFALNDAVVRLYEAILLWCGHMNIFLIDPFVLQMSPQGMAYELTAIVVSYCYGLRLLLVFPQDSVELSDHLLLAHLPS